MKVSDVEARGIVLWTDAGRLRLTLASLANFSYGRNTRVNARRAKDLHCVIGIRQVTIIPFKKADSHK
ncbi:MAG: hypothetical protein WA476_05705 [Acidobacteriaceae bacterium]